MGQFFKPAATLSPLDRLGLDGTLAPPSIARFGSAGWLAGWLADFELVFLLRLEARGILQERERTS